LLFMDVARGCVATVERGGGGGRRGGAVGSHVVTVTRGWCVVGGAVDCAVRGGAPGGRGPGGRVGPSGNMAGLPGFVPVAGRDVR